jgi:hypothetical protein
MTAQCPTSTKTTATVPPPSRTVSTKIAHPGPLPSSWDVAPVESWGSLYAAEADPFDPHALYVAGPARLGYLTTDVGRLTVELTWQGSSTVPMRSFVFVLALWADPLRAKHVVWGGSVDQGRGPAKLFESFEQGRDARDPHRRAPRWKRDLDSRSPRGLEASRAGERCVGWGARCVFGGSLVKGDSRSCAPCPTRRRRT